VKESENWIDVERKETSREEVETGNVEWRGDNGGVNGASVVWWPQEVVNVSWNHVSA